VKEGRFLTSGGMGVMGYSLPAAIGAKLAKPHRQVVAVCGDGSFQMQMCELATACQHNVEIKLIIMENGKLGMVKEFQDRLYGSRYIATDLSGDPDFVKLVEAYGIKAARATNNAEAKALAKEMLEYDGSYVLVCSVDPATPTL
jgi:acetolactate synthase-1/2/3 large subunit